MSKLAMTLFLLAMASASAGPAEFRGVNKLAAAVHNLNGEFLFYFSNGNQIRLLNRGAIVPLNLAGRLATSDGCCAHHAMPSLSADGRQIAYVRLKSANPRTEVAVIYDLESQKEREIFEAGIVWSVAWSPNGERLAAVADRAGDHSHSLHLINVLSGEVTSLFHDSLDVNGAKYLISDHAPPSWNRNGTQVALEARSGPSSAILLWDIEANQFHKLAEGGNPSWSPAQDEIAFFDPRSRKCFLISSDGSAQKVLFAAGEGPFKSKSAAFFFPIVWSPDGKQLLFHQWVDSDIVTEIYRLDLSKGKIHPLARTEVQIINWREGRQSSR